MRSIVFGLLIGAMLFGPVVAVCDAAEKTRMSRAERKEQRRQRELRRDLGVTLRNCLRVARELNDAGVLAKDDRKLMAKQIQLVIATGGLETDDPKASAKQAKVWSEKAPPGSPDWEAIMVWIEEVLIPLILMLMEIFGGMSDATLTPAVEVADCGQPVSEQLTLAA